MTRDNAKGPSHAARKGRTKKNSAEMLSTCPVDGAGWCPYPFSIAQLRKRMKAISTEVVADESADAETRPLARKK